MTATRGTPQEGDRSAFDTVNHADKHAVDIKNNAMLRHLPAPSAAGTYARDDGVNWTRQLGIMLSDLLGYARGAIIRGGSVAWEALSLGAANTVLKSDGTDASWDNVAHSELTGVAADDHHAEFTSEDIDTLAELNGILTDATLDDAGDSRTDDDAIHDNVDGEIHAISEKVTCVDADEIVIEDSEDAWSKKRVALSNLPGSEGSSSLRFSQVESVSVANTTDVSNLLGAGRGTKSISLSDLEVGSVLRLVLRGTITRKSGTTPTIDFDVSFGGAGNHIASVTSVSHGGAWWMELDLVVTGIDGSTLEFSSSGEVAGRQMFGFDHASSSHTSDMEVTVTAEWSAADADNEITCKIATIELLSAANLAVAAPSGLTAMEV